MPRRKNNPEVLQKRKHRKEQLDAAVAHMQATNPNRLPMWSTERIMRIDRFALQHGKRCIMWDDAGSGFYLVSATLYFKISSSAVDPDVVDNNE